MKSHTQCVFAGKPGRSLRISAIQSGSVTFLTTVTKYLTRSNLRKEEFVWTHSEEFVWDHSLKVESIMVGM